MVMWAPQSLCQLFLTESAINRKGCKTGLRGWTTSSNEDGLKLFCPAWLEQIAREKHLDKPWHHSSKADKLHQKRNFPNLEVLVQNFYSCDTDTLIFWEVPISPVLNVAVPLWYCYLVSHSTCHTGCLWLLKHVTPCPYPPVVPKVKPCSWNSSSSVKNAITGGMSYKSTLYQEMGPNFKV